MKLLCLGLIVLLLIGCGGDPDHQILHEASDIHNEAVAVEASVQQELKSLTSLKEMLSRQDSISADDAAMIARIDGIHRSHQWWQDNHVEVPGFGHEGHDHSGHDHSGHDHDHDHGPQLEVLPADMLLLQKEFRDTIFSIRDRIKSMKN